jgi:hypothetical protein
LSFGREPVLCLVCAQPLLPPLHLHALLCALRCELSDEFSGRIGRELKRWTLLHWRLRFDLARDGIIAAAAREVRLTRAPAVASVAPEEDLKMTKAPHAVIGFGRDASPDEDTSLPSSPRRAKYFPQDLDFIGTSARSFQSVPPVLRNRHAEALHGAFGVTHSQNAGDAASVLQLKQRAREEIRAVAGAMGRDGVREDTMSISMTERQEAHRQLYLAAAGGGAEGGVGGDGEGRRGRGDGASAIKGDGGAPAGVGSKSHPAQSPAHWTNRFRFFQPGDRVWPPTPSPRHSSGANGNGDRYGNGHRYENGDRAINISQPSPINLAAMPSFGGRK